VTDRQAQDRPEGRRPISKWAGRGQASARCGEPPPPELLKGIDEFNQQQFFECHETLEEIWIEEDDPIRYLYQGILKIGVGFHHALRGNHHGAVVVMGGGIELLQPFRPSCMGVDVESLVQASESALREFDRLGDRRIIEFNRSLIPAISVDTV
jgi:uncharacterized protein